MNLFQNGKTLLNLLFMSAILFLLIGSWGIYSYSKSAETTADISFTGVGEVVITNDIARLSFAFSEVNEDVVIARNTVNEKVSTTYKELKEAGINERDIKTTQYNVYPEYEYIQVANTSRRELKGYRVSHGTEIKIRSIDETGAILDIVTQNKPTDVGSLVFGVDEERRKGLEEQAIAMAITEARNTAKKISKDSGLRLGRILRIQTDGGNNKSPLLSARAVSLSAAPSTPISQGESTIRKTAVIFYEIK